MDSERPRDIRKDRYAKDILDPRLASKERTRTWATLYNRVGVVKRHFHCRKDFSFPFVEGFAFGVAFAFALRSSTKARFQNPAVELGSTSHLFGHSTSDHDSLFRLPAYREARRSNQSNGDLLLHQGGPRAALHANQLRVVDFAA